MKKTLFTAVAIASTAMAVADSSLISAGMGTPVIDGKLNDTVWQNSIGAAPFTLAKSNTFAKQQSVLRYAWDDENLYISFFCKAEILDPVNNKLHALAANYKGHDKDAIYRDDMVEILLENPAAPRIFDIAVSVTGAFNDCTVPKNGDMWNHRDFKWESGAKVATYVNKEVGNGFWSLEIAVPWKNLGGKPQNNDQWLTAAARFEKESREVSGFHLIPKGIHDKQCFGKLKFTSKVPGVTVTAMPEFAPGSNGLKAQISGNVPVELTCKTTFGNDMERSRQRIRKGAGELKFNLNGSGNFKFSWSIAGSSNLKEYFRSPEYSLSARSSKLAGTVKGGKLFINNRAVKNGGMLQSGLNKLAFKAEGAAELKLVCDNWQLPFPAGWKKSGNEYTLNLFSEFSTVWPNWHFDGVYINQGGIQQLLFAPTGFPGMRLGDYTLNLDLPEGMKLLSASGYYEIYPSVTVKGPTAITSGKSKFNRYSITINKNLKYTQSDKVPSHEWLGCIIAIDKNMPKGETQLAYHASSAAQAVAEVPRTLKVNVIDAVNGRQPKNYRVELWAGWLGRMLDKKAFPAISDYFIAAGITEDNSGMDAAGGKTKNFHLINFKNWNFNCVPYMKANPGTAQINAAGKPHAEYLCTTEMMSEKFAEYFRTNLKAWHKHYNEVQHIDWDFESGVFNGSLTCHCQRCFKAFADEFKLAAVPQNMKEVSAKYASQWTAFMNRRFAKLVELMYKSIHSELKAGTVFSVYTGYQSENTKRHYGVDWSMLDGKVDYAMVGYGRNLKALIATQKALPNTRMIIGELYYPYRTTERFKTTYSTPSNLMRRACDADGGILLYAYQTLDGRTFHALGEVTRTVAEYEEFFTSDKRFTDMLSVRGFSEPEYEVLGNGKGDYLVVILNQTRSGRKFDAKFKLPKGKVLVDVKTGKLVKAEFAGSLKGGEFAVYKTR